MASSKRKPQSRKSRSGGRGAAQGRAGADASRAASGAAQASGTAGPKVAVAKGSGPKVSPKVGPKAPTAQTRRQAREERERLAARERSQAHRSLGTYGPRPRSIFHPVPVSEIAIFGGLVAVIVGLVNNGGPALPGGGILCGLGVLEFSLREHLSGYRSHATLLAAFPAIVLEVVLAETVGVPSQRALLLAPVVPVFALAFWLLRRNFALARHARLTRPPAA